jgi:hypothetical protein
VEATRTFPHGARRLVTHPAINLASTTAVASDHRL